MRTHLQLFLDVANILYLILSSLVHSSIVHLHFLSVVCVAYCSLFTLLSPALFLLIFQGCISLTTSNCPLVSNADEFTALMPLIASCDYMFKAPAVIMYLYSPTLCFMLQSGAVHFTHNNWLLSLAVSYKPHI